MNNTNLSEITECFAKKYIKLKEIEQATHSDKLLNTTLIYGKFALSEARRLQEEFYPLSSNSEEIVITLLNQKFVYNGIDYSDEVNDKLIIGNCEAGLFWYIIDTVADEVKILNSFVSNMSSEEMF